MEKIKNVIIMAIVGIFVIMVIGNIKNQYDKLENAREENRVLSEKLEALRENNLKLEKQIAYATSSAYLNKQAREIFGMGSPNDYWIEETEGIDVDLFPRVTTEDETPIIRQWMELFTKK